MSKETIKSIDGRLFEIEYDKYITPEQRRDVLLQLEHRYECVFDNNKITSLTKTCPTTSKTVGQPVHLVVTPTGGLGPYTAIFKKGTTIIATISASPYTYDYILQAGDVGLQRFTSELSDACSTPQTCIEYCDIDVLQQLTCSITGCLTSINIDTNLPLLLTGYGGSGIYTYSWTVNGSPVSINSNYTFVSSNIGDYTIVGTVTDSLGNTCQQTCQVSVICPTLSCVLEVT